MVIEWRHVTRLLVPVAVVVVGHDRDPVQRVGDSGNVVSGVDDLLGGADRGREEQFVRGEGGLQLAHPSRESGLVLRPVRFALGLPASGVFPVQVEAVKVVLQDEFDYVRGEFGSGRWVVDQSAVLVALRIIPTADGDGDLDALGS